LDEEGSEKQHQHQKEVETIAPLAPVTIPEEGEGTGIPYQRLHKKLQPMSTKLSAIDVTITVKAISGFERLYLVAGVL